MAERGHQPQRGAGEVRLPEPVKAALVDDLFASPAPGQFKFWVFGDEPADASPAGLNFRCPCGCEQVHGIAFRRRDGDGRSGTWTWDGNREAPTCAPSIQSYDGDGAKHWHGFLRAGQWVNA